MCAGGTLQFWVLQLSLLFLQLIKETGGLKRLVALITDQVPPEEEGKGGKGGAPDKGGKGSRQAKKSAKECKWTFEKRTLFVHIV